jgi:demethylmenaquinone methyltransferase / 2-methoxy-6-polyprenyl-1,4-benzoquinol methylase
VKPLNPSTRAEYVREMFGRIAPRYDLMNRLMTGGQDGGWRKEVIRRAAPSAGGRVLDLGTGTGDLAFEALAQQPHARSVAADFTLEMMQIGRKRTSPLHLSGSTIDWVSADALRLPFEGESFEAVVSGFLLRNVNDVKQSISEQIRVLKPGGRLVVLDTTRPRPNVFSPLVRLHLRLVIPLLGSLLTGQKEAYRYLPESTENFMSAEQLAGRLVEGGLKEVGFRVFMLGAMAIHWGTK